MPAEAAEPSTGEDQRLSAGRTHRHDVGDDQPVVQWIHPSARSICGVRWAEKLQSSPANLSSSFRDSASKTACCPSANRLTVNFPVREIFCQLEEERFTLNVISAGSSESDANVPTTSPQGSPVSESREETAATPVG